MIADVVIAGGGPNGLMLACELALAGVAPVLLEALPEPSTEPKANGLLGQVVPLVDRRGLFERLGGIPGPPKPNSTAFMFAAMAMDLSLLADSPVYTLPVPQAHIVRVLTERAAELGVRIRAGHRLVGLCQDQNAVTLEVTGPDGSYELTARHLVGADGAHSAVRKLSGIGFPGVTQDRTTVRTAHAALPADWVDTATGVLRVPGHGPILPFIPERADGGGFTYAPFPGLPALVSTSEWDQPRIESEMSLDELRASIRRVLGVDVPLGPPDGPGPHVLRRMVGGNVRVAERFRDGRVFLIGDAAHVGTAGGSGLNLGMQDAAGLAWKLAAEARGWAPASLLDTHDAERRPAARRMVMYGQAQAALSAPGGDVTALRELFGELLADAGTVRRLADLTAGSDIRYDIGGVGAHPLVGAFAPEFTVRTRAGAVRLAELTRTARPLLLDLTHHGSAAPLLAGWQDRVDLVTARAGDDAPASAMLIRPDGYTVWASDAATLTDTQSTTLREAALSWFGVPAPAPGDTR